MSLQGDATMQHGEVPLPPNSIEEETNEIENQARKRGNTKVGVIESWRRSRSS